MSTKKVAFLYDLVHQEHKSLYSIVLEAHKQAYTRVNLTVVNRVMRTLHTGLYNDDNMPYWLSDFIEMQMQFKKKRRQYLDTESLTFNPEEDYGDCN